MHRGGSLCRFCGSWFPSHVHLREHIIESGHQMPPPSSAEVAPPPPYLHPRHNQTPYLRPPIVVQPGNAANVTTAPYRGQQRTDTNRCAVCAEVFTSYHNLQAHLASKRHYRCRHCFHMFSSQNEMNQHIYRAHTEPSVAPSRVQPQSVIPPHPSSITFDGGILSAERENQVVL